MLTGGSAYGLAAADGVMRWLEEQGRGVAMDSGAGEKQVPIVPAAVIFDLPVGSWRARPTSEFGYAAAENAGTDVVTGTVGAGVGARAGVLKGGVGTASMVLDSGVTVGALVVVNSFGDVVDPATGLPWMKFLAADLELKPPPPAQVAAFAALVAEAAQREALNTTVAVVATDAALSPSACRRVAVAAHDGLPARSGPRTLRSTATRCSRWPRARSTSLRARRCLRRCRRKPSWPVPSRCGSRLLGPRGAGCSHHRERGRRNTHLS